MNMDTNTNTDMYADMDMDMDATRESFAIQGSIIMNTLTDLLERVRTMEQQPSSEPVLPSDHGQNFNSILSSNKENTLDVYKTSRLVEEPPKKRMKLK